MATLSLESGRYNSDQTIDKNKLEDSVNRVMPQFKVDEPARSLRTRYGDAGRRYTQTLEPRMRYLYVPYRDQAASITSLLLAQSGYRLFATALMAVSTIMLPPTGHNRYLA